MLFLIDINVKFFNKMEELSGEIKVHKRKKETMKERKKKTKKILRSESLTTDKKNLNC